MILTVVIPAYNVKNYLQTCVESVDAFPIREKEIIIIDDGCTDGTFDDCDSWMRSLETPCRVIHQQNRGVSAARNEGMAMAKGEWLWFVDADDVIDSDIVLSESDFQNANFVITGFVWKEKGEENRFGAYANEIPYNLWRCWFRRSIVDELQLKFSENRKYAEDQEFILKYLILGNQKYDLRRNTYPIKYPVYHYTMRENSAMTRKGTKAKQIEDVRNVLFMLMILAIKQGMILSPWVFGELKRIAKTLYITIKR